MARSDFTYELDRQMLLLNFNSPDQGRISLNILKCLNHDLSKAIAYADSLQWKARIC